MLVTMVDHDVEGDGNEWMVMLRRVVTRSHQRCGHTSGDDVPLGLKDLRTMPPNLPWCIHPT